MITIEVLIAMLILFLVIAMSFEQIKFFTNIVSKQRNFEDEYLVVSDILQKNNLTICKNNLQVQGRDGSYQYELRCTKIEELKNYVFDSVKMQAGNIGNRMVQLYKIELNLKKNKREKKYYYYVTRTKILE